jgi:site-specific DNA-methyltransferase (adenine-specific)
MQIRKLNINTIREGYHPRKDFTGKEELRGSIEQEGLLDPILVRQKGDEYLVIDGVMRLRVVKELGWQKVDCIIQDADEEKAYHLAYIKNTERKNLNAIEQALHFQEVQEKFGYNVEDLVRLGYAPHRSTIDNKLSLLTLPEKIQEQIAKGEIHPTSGYHLATLQDQKDQLRMADEIIDNGMSVKKVERKIKSLIDSRKNEDVKSPMEIPEAEIPGVFIKDASDMSEIEDESVSLIVTSPGYFVEKEYEKGMKFEDHIKNLDDVFSECGRVLVPGGKICINFVDIHTFETRNGGKPEIKLMAHEYQKILVKHGIRLVDEIIWKKHKNWKNNPQCNHNEISKHCEWRILRNTEKIHIYRKDGTRKVPFHKEFESKISKEEWKEWVDGVWEITPVKKQDGHPAQFPEELPRRLIKMYSHKGDVVLDPFGGTMTTVKVANELGRVGVGYEREEQYKPVIMEKLGIKEEELRKPDLKIVQKGKDKKEPDPMSQYQDLIIEILGENNKTSKDLMYAEFPMKSSISKDDIVIEWAPDSEDPEPAEPGGVLKAVKAKENATMKKAA